MHIVLVGLNHKSAPIELRERLAIPQEALPRVLGRLREEVGLREAAVLSTCNRVEIYGRAPELDGTMRRLQQFLSAYANVEQPETLTSCLYSWAEPHSIRHLFAVTSGLDSMVLGESEILQQVKRAYESAKDHGATGKTLNALFQRALNTAKEVRTHTGIGRGCTSVGTVSVELAEKIFGHLSGAAVLLIGAGKIGELTLEHVATRGVRSIRMMNRSFERAAHLAETYHAAAVPLESLDAELRDADIVISSTSAPAYLLTRLEVAAAMRQRHQRPLCLVDLGVPRNIDPAAGALENVYLFDIDDLQGLVHHSLSEREQAMTASQAIIDRKVDRFLSWWHEEVTGCVPSSLGPAAAP